MSEEPVARVDLEKLMTKEFHELMLAMPVRDGFCRFYGAYVGVGQDACFPDGTLHTCTATDTFTATGRSCK